MCSAQPEEQLLRARGPPLHCRRRAMFTVDHYRARYARSSSEELLTLLALDAQQLTPEARQALDEETARRGLKLGDPPVHALAMSDVTVLERVVYPKVQLGPRLGAHIVDMIIGMGPVIMAAVFTFLFRLGPPSATAKTINMLATAAWAIYYGFTKDGPPNGQSIGKKMFNLMVVDVRTGEPCRLGQSITRAFVRMFLSAIPVFGWMIEPFAVFMNDKGRRIGDRVADTQVIEVSAFEATAATRTLRRRPEHG